MSIQDQENGHIASGRGKWSRAGVPHRGWHCVEIEDRGSPDLQCEMCESQQIRYIHHMQHASYPAVLAVGCICAGNMEGSVYLAQEREASMKSRAGKRSRWVGRTWKTSKKGYPYLTADGYRVTVYPRGAQWAATIAAVGSKQVHHSQRGFPTIQQAKLAAFDHITRLLSVGKT